MTNNAVVIGKRILGDETRTTRSVTLENLNEPRTLTSFIGDATRLWNKAPLSIRCAKSIGIAEQVIKMKVFFLGFKEDLIYLFRINFLFRILYFLLL